MVSVTRCAGGAEAGAAEQPSEDADLELARAIAASMGDNAAWQARFYVPPYLALPCYSCILGLHASLGSGLNHKAPESWAGLLGWHLRRQRRSCLKMLTVDRAEVHRCLAPHRGQPRTEAQGWW